MRTNGEYGLARRRFFKLWPFAMIALGWCYNLYAFTLQVSPGVMGAWVMQDLSLGAFAISVVTGSFFYAYSFLQIPAGLLLDRFGARYTMTVGLLACALGNVLLGIAKSGVLATFAEIILGMGTSVAYISVLFLALRWFSSRHFGLLVGITELVGALGAVFSSAFLWNVVNGYGWREVVFAFSIFAFLLAFFTHFLIRDRRLRSTATNIAAVAPLPLSEQFRILLGNSQVWWIGLCALSLWAPAIGFGALWGNPYLISVYHLSPMQATHYSTFLWIGAAMGAPFVGVWAESIKCMHFPFFVYAALGFVATSLLLFFSLSLWVLGVTLFAFGFAASGTCLSFALIKHHVPERLAGAALGFTNMMVVLGGPLIQFVIGFLLDYQWNGQMDGKIRLYSSGNFRIALTILPLCFFVAFVIARKLRIPSGKMSAEVKP